MLCLFAQHMTSWVSFVLMFFFWSLDTCLLFIAQALRKLTELANMGVFVVMLVKLYALAMELSY